MNGYEEYLKKHGVSSQKQETYDEYLYKNIAKPYVDEVNNLIADFNRLKMPDVSKYGDYSSQIGSYGQISFRADKLKNSIEQLKNNGFVEQYSQLSKILQDIKDNADGNRYQIKNVNDFYSSFEDENQYNKWDTDRRFYAEYGDLTAENVDYFIKTMEKRKANRELNGYEQDFYDWIIQYDLTHGYKDENYYNQRIAQLEAVMDAELERKNYEMGTTPDGTSTGVWEKSDTYKWAEGRIGDLKYLRNQLNLENVYEDKGYSLHEGAIGFNVKAAEYENSVTGEVNKPTSTKDVIKTKNIEDKVVFAYKNKDKYSRRFWKSDLGWLEYTGHNTVEADEIESWYKYSLLEPDEFSTYCYLAQQDKTKGTNSAEKFLSDMENTLDMRVSEELHKSRKADMNEEGFKGAFSTGLYNTLSVPASVLGGVQALPSATVSLIKGEDINIYSDSFALSNFASDVRAITSEKIDSPAWNLVYNAVMSTADSLLAAGVFRGAAPYILAASAATSRMKELVSQGASDFEIVVGSLASGLIEVVTEKVSIDRLFDGDIKPTKLKEFVTQGLIQAGVEGSEEIASEVLNNLSDELLRGQMSDYNQKIRQYQAEGLSKDEATKKASNEVLVNIMEAALSGMISGGIGGVFVGGNQMRKFNVIGKNIIESNNVDSVLEAAEYLGKLNPEIAGQTKALNNFKENAKSGKSNAAYNRTLGKVAVTVAENAMDVKQNIVESAVSNELKRRKVGSDVVNKVSKIVSKYIAGEKLSSSEQGYLKHNNVASTVMQEIKAAQEQIKAEAITPVNAEATASTPSAPQWAVDMVKSLSVVDSAVGIVKYAATGKTKEDEHQTEVNRMIKLLSIASGKTTAEQEAEAGEIPYSQYIKEKEISAQKENTADNSGESSPMENVDSENNTENGDKPNIFEEVFSEENQNEKKKRVISLGKKLGTPITFSDEVKQGKYNPVTREITLNPNLTIGEMYMFVFKHEWVHDLKNRKLWSGYKKFLFGDSLNFTDFCETHLLNDYGIEAKGQEAIQKLTEKYYENWRSSDEMTAEEKAAFDTEAAEEEMVCDFVAERQLGGIRKNGDFDQESYDALLELATRKRNIFQRFIDWIKSLVEKIKGDPTFTDMAEELEYLNERIARVYESKVTDTGETVSKHTILTNIVDKDGNEYGPGVLLDTEVFEGTKPRNWNYVLKDYLKTRINNEGTFIMPVVDENGKIQMLEFAKLNERIGKNGGKPHKAIDKLTSTHGNIAKLSTIHIDEIIEVSKENDVYHTGPDGHGKFDKNGWLHRSAYVVDNLKNDIYKISIDIAETQDGRYIMYALDGKTKKVGPADVNSLRRNSKVLQQKTYYDDFTTKSNKSQEEVKEAHSISIPFSEEAKAEKRKKYAESIVKKYGGSIDAERVEAYLKEIAEATENNDYHKAYKIAAKAAKYIADNGAYAVEKMVYKKKSREILKNYITEDMVIHNRSDINDRYMQAVELLKEYYFNQFNEDAKIDAENILEEIAREIAEAPSKDSDLYRQVEEIREYVRGVRLISPDNIYDGDFNGGYEQFRRKNKGKIWLSKSGILQIDVFYEELNSVFGETFFPKSITNLPDQLQRISEVINMEAEIDGIVSENIEEAAQSIKNNLMAEIEAVIEQSQTDSFMKAEEDLAEQIFDAAVYNRTNELSHKASEAQRIMAEKRQNELRGYIEKTDRQIKRAQRVNGHFDELIRQDREARELIQDRKKNIDVIRRTVNRLYQRLITNSNTKNIPEEFKEAVTELCEIFYRSDITAFDRRDFHTLSAMYKNYSGETNKTGNYSEIFDPEISEMINTVANTLHGKKLQELDYLNVILLRNIIDNINHIISEESKIVLAGKKYEVETLGRQSLNEFKNKKPVSNLAFAEGARNFFKYENMTPVYFFDRVGGTLKKLYTEIRMGMDKIAVNLDATKDFFTKAKTKYNYDSWKNQKIEYKTVNGDVLNLTIEQVLHLYATAKREMGNVIQSSKHLFAGGIVINNGKSFIERVKALNNSKGEARNKLERILIDDVNNTALQITLQDITEISALLTDEQIAYMDELVKYMSVNMASLGNETSMQMCGIRKFNEDYYIPYNSAEEFIASQPGYKAPKTHQSASFTKNTVKGANTPLVVENFSQVVARHCNQMIQYNGLTVPLSNFNKVYNYTSNIGSEDSKSRSLKNSISTAMGKGARKYIDQFLEDMNGDVRTIASENIGSKLLRLHKASEVMESASVVVQQPASIGRAMAYIGPRYFVDLRLHQGDYEQMKKYAPVAIIKEMGRFDTGVGSSTTQWLLSTKPEGIKNKTEAFLKNEEGYRDDLFSDAAGKADEITWGMIWAAAKNKVAHDTNLIRNSEEFLQEAGRLFSEVIDRTQVYDSTISRSQMMRSKSLWSQMVTSFMAESTVTLNMLYDMAHDINSKHFKMAGKKLGAVIFTAVLTAALKSVVTAARDDEEDKSYFEKYFRDLVSESFDNLNVANMLPIVRDVYSLVQGYDVHRADMTVLDRVIDAFKVAFDEDKGSLEKLEKIASSVGTFTGIPVKNIWRDMKAIYNVVVNNILNPKNKTTGQGIKYAMQEGLPFGTKDNKKENYIRLLEAAESGDKDAYKMIYDHLVELGADESDIKSGLKRVIKEDSKDYEDEFQDYMNRLYKIAFYKGLDDSEKKKVENDVSNFVSEGIVTDIMESKPTEAYSKVKEAEKAGVSAEYFYLSKIATNVENADTDGSGTVTKKERLAAIYKMNVSNDIKAALIALYS